ncbi:MAG TPA: hypothetical protein VHT95_14030 [Vicinamibacterales bacterium]|nr:hypothetical protein [Vicinamibacterales bacterium]
MPSRSFAWLAILLVSAAITTGAAPAENDLDAFMKLVVARRDDNWKKLQQYIFDEREQLEMRGPDRVPVWGERREYTWYIRDGFFVRSPTRFNGVTVSDAERRTFEASYLKQAQERDKRAARGAGRDGSGSTTDNGAAPGAPDREAELAQDVSGVIRQNRPPQFISSAYFLRFKFEEGKYALAGRETIDGHEVLRIEYYPARMFGGTDRRRTGKEPSDRDKARDAAFQRMMNKVALVTLWVEPKAHQIVKYTFDNVGFDFLPAQWLVHVSDVKATMTVGQPFPDVWLPTSMAVNLAMTVAIGQLDVRYDLEYRDYRIPSVTSKIGIK